tara:strand:+ start:29768 stop:32416 length:2649 start_codon:yes stop_codon:yes gene_type:complete
MADDPAALGKAAQAYRAQAEALKSLNDALKENQQALQDLLDQKKLSAGSVTDAEEINARKLVESKREQIRLQKELLDSQELKASRDANQLILEQDKIDKLNSQAEAANNMYTKRAIQQAADRAADERKEKSIQWQIDNEQELTEEEKKKLDIALKNQQIDQKRPQYLREAKELSSGIAQVFQSYASHPFFNVDNMLKITGALRQPGQLFKSLGTGIITGLLNSVIGLVFEINKSEAAFFKATRASKSFQVSMTEVYKVARQNVVSLKDFYKATTDLVSTFTDFTQISTRAAQSLALTTSTMVQLGHSSQTLAKDLQILSVGFGMIPQEAEKTLRELDAFATDIGVPPSQLTEQFATMGDGLTKLGKDGVSAFKELARVSKITGFEMGKILRMTDRFDTFEGAATAAGKLNAALGSNFVNAMDLMVETDPVKRFEMMRGSLLDAGLEFDNMSYYQRKFIAESLGLESVSDLAAMMRGDLESLDAEIGKTSADYAEMAKNARLSANFQERLNAIMQGMIPILRPLIEGIEMLLYNFEEGTKSQSDFSDEARALQPTLNSLAGAFKFFIQVAKIAIDYWPWIVGTMIAMKAASLGAAFGLWSVSPAVGGITVSIGKLGAALTTLGGAVLASGGTLLIGLGVVVTLLGSLGYLASSVGEAFQGMAALFSSFDGAGLRDLSSAVGDVSSLDYTTAAGNLTLLSGAMEDVSAAMIDLGVGAGVGDISTLISDASNMDTSRFTIFVNEMVRLKDTLNELPGFVHDDPTGLAASAAITAPIAARASATLSTTPLPHGTEARTDIQRALQTPAVAATVVSLLHAQTKIPTSGTDKPQEIVVNAHLPVLLDGQQIGAAAHTFRQTVQQQSNTAFALGGAPPPVMVMPKGKNN